jgi:hypothetical protein
MLGNNASSPQNPFNLWDLFLSLNSDCFPKLILWRGGFLGGKILIFKYYVEHFTFEINLPIERWANV